MQHPTPVDRDGIQVISRAAAVLRIVSQNASGITLTEIATPLGLARSTVQRIVGALVDEEMLVSAGARAGFTLGPLLVRLAAAVVTDTERLVRPVLEALSAATGETVDLSVLQSDRALFVDQVMGTARVVASSAIGTSFPLHSTANGKALLTLLPGNQRESLIPTTIEATTGNTVTDRAALAVQIRAAEQSGIAFDLEEHAEGVCAVGAAFNNRVGRKFAISIPVPANRFAGKRDNLERALRDAMVDIAALNP